MTTPQKPRRRTQAKTIDKFDWFTPEATAKIGERITAAGPGARLEIRCGKDRGLLARVVVAGAATTAAADTSDINDSRRCPPICP